MTSGETGGKKLTDNRIFLTDDIIIIYCYLFFMGARKFNFVYNVSQAGGFLAECFVCLEEIFIWLKFREGIASLPRCHCLKVSTL